MWPSKSFQEKNQYISNFQVRSEEQVQQNEQQQLHQEYTSHHHHYNQQQQQQQQQQEQQHYWWDNYQDQSRHSPLHHHQQHHHNYFSNRQQASNESSNRARWQGAFIFPTNNFNNVTRRAASARSIYPHMRGPHSPSYHTPFHPSRSRARFSMHAQSVPEHMTNLIRINFTINKEVHEIRYNGDLLIRLFSPSLLTPPPTTTATTSISSAMSTITSPSLISLSTPPRTPITSYTLDAMLQVSSPLALSESNNSIIKNTGNTTESRSTNISYSVASSSNINSYSNSNVAYSNLPSTNFIASIATFASNTNNSTDNVSSCNSNNNNNNNKSTSVKANHCNFYVLQRYPLQIRSVEAIKENAQVYNSYYELVFTIRKCSNNYGPRNLMAVLEFPWGTRHYLGPLFSSETIMSARFVRQIPTSLELLLCVDQCIDYNSLTPFPSEMLLKEHIKVILENDEYCGSVSSANLQNVVRELPFYAEGIKRFKKWSVFVNHFSTHYGCWRLVKYSSDEHKALGLSACTPPNELRLVSNRLAAFSTRGDIERDKVKLAAIAEYRDLVMKAHNEEDKEKPLQSTLQAKEVTRIAERRGKEESAKRINLDVKDDTHVSHKCNVEGEGEGEGEAEESSGESEDDNDAENDLKSTSGTSDNLSEVTRKRWCRSITSQLTRDKLQWLAESHSLIKLHCINYCQYLQRYADTHSILFSPLHPVQIDESIDGETKLIQKMKTDLTKTLNVKKRMS